MLESGVASGEWPGGAVEIDPNDVLECEGGGSVRGIEILSLSELLGLPDPEWLVEDILPRSCVALMYGDPASGKTFVALDIALSVAAGAEWCGHFTAKGRVLYVAAEGRFGMKLRVKAWAGPRLRDEEDPLFTGFAVVGDAVRFLEPSDVTGLITAIEISELNPDLVIVDTLARCMVPGDENKASDMGMFIAACDEIRTRTGAAVLIIHHKGKSAATERGSSALRGATDTVMKVEKEDRIVTVVCEKQKDALEFRELRFELIPEVVGTGRDGRDLTSCRLEPRLFPFASSAGVAMTKADPGEVILQVLQDCFFESGAAATTLLETSGLPKTTFYRHLKKLVEAGRAERFLHAGHDRYRLPQEPLPVPVPVPVPPSPTSSTGTGPEPVPSSSSSSPTHPLKGWESGTGTGTGPQAASAEAVDPEPQPHAPPPAAPQPAPRGKRRGRGKAAPGRTGVGHDDGDQGPAVGSEGLAAVPGEGALPADGADPDPGGAP